MTNKCSFILRKRCLKPLTLSTVGNDGKFFVVCKSPGGRDTINCQMPGSQDSSCIKCPGSDRGDAHGWNSLAHNSKKKIILAGLARTP